MNKKGFTLIEIIVVITLIAFIGTISFFGIRLVNKNIKTTKLEQIEDKIFNAVSIYVETNEEVKNNLYTNKNGVYVPLNVLQNEGLIDFQDIKITDKDYVITMLGSENNDGACVDTTSIGSWNDGNKTIYLCTTASGTTNIQTIGGQADNISKIERERYYFSTTLVRGRTAITNANYIKYNNTTYRILFIDTDDSLVLIHTESFGNAFNGLTQPISRCTYGSDGSAVDNNDIVVNCTDNTIYVSVHNTEIGVDCFDAYKASKYALGMGPWFYKEALTFYGGTTISGFRCKEITHKKIHLKPCMKIGKGTGYLENPYELINECTKNN